MFNTSSAYRELMAQPSRTLSARGLIIYPDTAQQPLTAQHISGFSVIEDAGDHIPLGSAAASTVTLRLDNRAGEWNKGGSIRGAHALEGAEVRLELGVWDGAAFVWENIGRYILEDAIGQEQEPLIELKGMDYLGNRAQRAFIDDLAYPMTLAEMADAACFQAGITRKTQTFINSDVVISTRPEWSGDISCRDALAQIAACAGGFARIDRNGQLEIVTLSGTETVAIDTTRYKKLTRQAESFGPLNAITFEGRAAKEGSPEITPVRLSVTPEVADTALNSIGISGNALLLPGTASFNALKDGLTGALFGLSFAGASLIWQGDQSVTVGDCIGVTDTKDHQESVIITKNSVVFDSGFEMASGNRLKGNAESGTNSSKQRIFTPDGKINAEAISGVVKRLQIAIGAIGEAQIDDASITVAKIKTATIEALTAAALSAVTARIQYLIANELVTDELYAALAEIATAEIGTAEIDWAKIKDLVSGRAIFTQGEAGQMYIADLAVTEANMLSLTVGELIVRGNDGLFYALTVDEEGKITTEQKFIVNNDITDETINAATKLVEGSVTASRIDATDIFATNAIIKGLIAANIDTDVFFAREGVINKITLDYVTPLNDAITIVSGDLEETNAAIDNLDAIGVERLVIINTALQQLNTALSVVESDLSNNASASEFALAQINAAIEALEAEALAIQNGVAELEANKVTTDQYIRMGLLYVDDNDIPRYGVAIGENLTTVTDGEGRVVLERRALATTITSDRISFWRNGRETLYISEDKVVIIRLGMGPWEINTDYGWTLLYKGVS